MKNFWKTFKTDIADFERDFNKNDKWSPFVYRRFGSIKGKQRGELGKPGTSDVHGNLAGNVGPQQQHQSLSGVKVDLFETSDSFLAFVEIPGLQKHEVTVSEENGHILVRGEFKKHELVTNATPILSERQYGPWERKIHIPANVRMEEINAIIDHGLLNIRIPKKDIAPIQARREIQIQ